MKVQLLKGRDGRENCRYAVNEGGAEATDRHRHTTVHGGKAEGKQKLIFMVYASATIII